MGQILIDLGSDFILYRIGKVVAQQPQQLWRRDYNQPLKRAGFRGRSQIIRYNGCENISLFFGAGMARHTVLRRANAGMAHALLIIKHADFGRMPDVIFQRNQRLPWPGKIKKACHFCVGDDDTGLGYVIAFDLF